MTYRDSFAFISDVEINRPNPNKNIQKLFISSSPWQGSQYDPLHLAESQSKLYSEKKGGAHVSPEKFRLSEVLVCSLETDAEMEICLRVIFRGSHRSGVKDDSTKERKLSREYGPSEGEQWSYWEGVKINCTWVWNKSEALTSLSVSYQRSIPPPSRGCSLWGEVAPFCQGPVWRRDDLLPVKDNSSSWGRVPEHA